MRPLKRLPMRSRSVSSTILDPDYDVSILPGLIVDDATDASVVYSGLIGPCGNPIVRHTLGSLPVGFLADHTEHERAASEPPSYHLYVPELE
jgi:hypothetical protein